MRAWALRLILIGTLVRLCGSHALILCPGTHVQQTLQPTNPCELVRLPLSLAPLAQAKLNLEVLNHYLTLVPEVRGTLVLRNQTSKQITGITLVVNYEDGQGIPLFTIVYQEGVEGTERVIAGNIRSFFQGRLGRPVQPGEVFSLAGTNLLTTTKIPVRAVVSVFDLKFADKSLSGLTQGAFRSDPILEHAPDQIFRLAASPNNLPQDVLLKVSISRAGRVTDIDFASNVRLHDKTLAYVKDELRTWHFLPAIRDGHEAPCELFMLLRFRHADEPTAHDCFLAEGVRYADTFVIVTLKSLPDLKGQWMLFYGGYPVNGWTFLGQQILETAPWKIEDH